MHGRASETDEATAQRAIARGCASGCSTAGRRASTIMSWSNICSTLTIPRVDTKPLAKRLIARVRRDRAAALGERRHACGAKG